MRLEFVKMHGLGNDFVVIEDRTGRLALARERVRALADRRRGVGCDQVLVVRAGAGAADFALAIYNQDGSEAAQCGNGVRCVAALLQRRGLARDGAVTLATRGGPVHCRVERPGWVRADMGVPRLAPQDVPFVASAPAPSYPLSLGHRSVEIGAVSIGNPHAVLTVDDVAEAPVAALGPRIQAHPRFPEGANVGFMQVVGPTHIRLRVYERGAGETLACGSGACAAVVVARGLGLAGAAPVAVDLPGGRLEVSWAGEGERLWMSGPVSWVFEGVIEL